MKQGTLEPILSEGAGTFDFYAGFQWSLPPRIRPYVSGLIASPKAIEGRKVAGPLILDNGAYPAYRDGVNLKESKQLKTLLKSANEHRPEMIVVPDVVGEGDVSFKRTKNTAPTLYNETKDWSPRLLFAVQEGMKIWPMVELAKMYDGGIFIGGQSYTWKRYAVETVRAKCEEIYVHTARIWKEGDCHFHSSRVQSFDNTTFCRGQNFNTSKPFEDTLNRYCVNRMGTTPDYWRFN